MVFSMLIHIRELIITMVVGAINRDYDKITRNALKICETTGEVNMRRLELQVTELVDLNFHQSLENIDMRELFAYLVMLADLFALGRALVLLQGDGELLDPEFNIANQVAPYFKKLVRRRFRPEQYVMEMAVSSKEMLRLSWYWPRCHPCGTTYRSSDWWASWVQRYWVSGSCSLLSGTASYSVRPIIIQPWNHPTNSNQRYPTQMHGYQHPYSLRRAF